MAVKPIWRWLERFRRSSRQQGFHPFLILWWFSSLYHLLLYFNPMLCKHMHVWVRQINNNDTNTRPLLPPSTPPASQLAWASHQYERTLLVSTPDHLGWQVRKHMPLPKQLHPHSSQFPLPHTRLLLLVKFTFTLVVLILLVTPIFQLHLLNLFLDQLHHAWIKCKNQERGY